MKQRTTLLKFKVTVEDSPYTLNSIQKSKTAEGAIAKGKMDANKLLSTMGKELDLDKLKWTAQEIL